MLRREFLTGAAGLACAAALGSSAAELLFARTTLAKDGGGGGGGDGDGGQAGPPFDFSDAFYRQNGLDPAQILNRVNGTDGASVFGQTTDPTRRGVRVLSTFGGFDNDGHIVFFNVFGEMTPSTFLPNSAGQQALSIGNTFRAFFFPRRAADPLNRDGVARRQDNVFDTRHGFFGNDPLSIWRRAFVNFTDAALNTAQGQQALAALASRNGTDLDGTPVLRSLDDIESLSSAGFVTVRERAADGSQASPWLLCPLITSGAGGAIAPDAFLTVARRSDGTPVVPDLVRQFNCLQTTGSFC